MTSYWRKSVFENLICTDLPHILCLVFLAGSLESHYSQLLPLMAFTLILLLFLSTVAALVGFWVHHWGYEPYLPPSSESPQQECNVSELRPRLITLNSNVTSSQTHAAKMCSWQVRPTRGWYAGSGYALNIIKFTTFSRIFFLLFPYCWTHQSICFWTTQLIIFGHSSHCSKKNLHFITSYCCQNKCLRLCSPHKEATVLVCQAVVRWIEHWCLITTVSHCLVCECLLYCPCQKASGMK